MADGSDRLISLKELGHHALQNRAFQIGTHAASPVTAGQKQAIEFARVNDGPPQRGFEARIIHHCCIGAAAVPVGAHEQTEQWKAPEDRDEAPQIKPLTAHHYLVCLAGLAVGCRENHRMAKRLKNLPADRRFRRVKISCRDRNEYLSHDGALSETEVLLGRSRCANADSGSFGRWKHNIKAVRNIERGYALYEQLPFRYIWRRTLMGGSCRSSVAGRGRSDQRVVSPRRRTKTSTMTETIRTTAVAIS